MSDVNSKFIDRVRKMLAIANNSGATAEERDTALTLATDLINKHNLPSADELSRQQVNAEEARVIVRTPMWAQAGWAHQVYNACARLMMCTYFIGEKTSVTKTVGVFVGKESNTISAQLLAEFVCTSIRREVRARYKYDTAALGRSYATGVTVEINRRVSALLAGPGGGADSVALVRQTEAQKNDEFVAENMKIGKAKASKHLEIDNKAYAAGHEFGAKIQLTRQVDQAAAKQRLEG